MDLDTARKVDIAVGISNIYISVWKRKSGKRKCTSYSIYRKQVRTRLMPATVPRPAQSLTSDMYFVLHTYIVCIYLYAYTYIKVGTVPGPVAERKNNRKLIN